ncbi:glycosyltransferase [bacterium]
MEVIFKSNIKKPKLSIILLDWSCRESFHVFHYLNKQTVPRDLYEIIWLEFYDKRSCEIESRLAESRGTKNKPILDQWIVMDIPKDVYYHKHLMYNTGITAARGNIFVICDSDAVAAPTFVESILNSFKKDKDIVLHFDQVRNTDKRFHPFNYPSVEQILEYGCINWAENKTLGLQDTQDPLHTRNYGACMCALKSDLINIGGADEHIDYLGHICGPYDMTFRLINNGKKEIWHNKEFLYHVWHPGSDGVDNYLGPHDGKNMSITALEARTTKRILPWVENPAIKYMRLYDCGSRQEDLLKEVIPYLDLKRWTIKNAKKSEKKYKLNKQLLIADVVEGISYSLSNKKVKNIYFKNAGIEVLLFKTMILMFLKQIWHKFKTYNRNKLVKRTVFQKIYMFFVFMRRMWKNNSFLLQLCEKTVRQLFRERSVTIYGVKDLAGLFCVLADKNSIKIKTIYDEYHAGRKFMGIKVLHPNTLYNYEGKILLSSIKNNSRHIEYLKDLGIQESQIISLQ